MAYTGSYCLVNVVLLHTKDNVVKRPSNDDILMAYKMMMASSEGSQMMTFRFCGPVGICHTISVPLENGVN